MNGPVLANHSLHVRFAILLPAMNVEDVKNEVLKEEDMVKSEEGSQEDMGLNTVQPGPRTAGITDRNLLKQTLLEIFASNCEKAGGPVQFLEQSLNRERLDEVLLKMCPWMDSIDYVQPSLLGKREKALVHITMLSHEVAASTKGYILLDLCVASWQKSFWSMDS